ncbi:hypothetical protein ABZP36_009291 [Zizania latifolia]
MAPRWRSRARRDPDLDEEGSPPQRRRAPRSDDDDEAGNEDLSLEIVARARRREATRGGRAEFLSLSSGDEVDEDAVVELGEADPSRKQKKKRRKAKKKPQKEAPGAAAAAEKEPQVAATQELQTGTAESVLTEDRDDAPLSDNIVLRKLLRIPRYFDPGETILETCFNCGEEGHVAVNCPMEKRKKPCFVCGLFGHNAKQCTQGQDCFICKKGGHIAKDCPEKHKRNTQQSTFCLRCGGSGHDMFGCANDYPLEDVKEIKCYVCNQKGHLCCADFSDFCPKEVSCYNCAQPGHTGLGCAKQRREASTLATPTLCYKCGEEGHFARGCTKNAKSGRMKGESSAYSRKKGKDKKDFGTRSAPYDARKSSKRKSPIFEERRDRSQFKSRARGGWTADDADDQSYKKYKSNVWASPSTPKKQYSNQQFNSGGDYSTPPSSRWQNHHGFASPSSTYSPNARKNSFSSSRFASNTHVRFGRS